MAFLPICLLFSSFYNHYNNLFVYCQVIFVTFSFSQEYKAISPRAKDLTGVSEPANTYSFEQSKWEWNNIFGFIAAQIFEIPSASEVQSPNRTPEGPSWVRRISVESWEQAFSTSDLV